MSRNNAYGKRRARYSIFHRTERHLSLAAVAAIAGLSYHAWRSTGWVRWSRQRGHGRAAHAARARFEVGKLRFQRSGPRSRDPNQWEWSGTMFTW